MTQERTILNLERREMLLSFQIDFNLVSAAVVCAILESISGLEPSSDITEPGIRVQNPTNVHEKGACTIGEGFPLSSQPRLSWLRHGYISKRFGSFDHVALCRPVECAMIWV